MPRKCLACSSSEREAIDKALVAGEPLRNIAKRVSISPAGLLRHKSHVAGTIAKAQERREEKLGDAIFDEMKRVLAKAWELLGKMELAGDYRGAIVAAREVRECLESLNGLVTKAEGASARINVIVENIGIEAAKRGSPTTMQLKGDSTSELEPRPASLSHAELPPATPASQSNRFAIVPARKVRPLVGAVGYLQGMR
jgi:hypothetical protein